ncbi:MAG: succinoglycan biosynthesis protein exoa [Acidimicrobiales bacterium]|nr:MAG: succinoglycan biosynthesis protein exoa [Acidimicrobiales bacterium]
MNLAPVPEIAPAIDVIVPALNAASTLDACLDAILDQDYVGAISVVVAVGPGRDATWEVAQGRAAEDGRVTVVANPTGRTPTGLNIATRAGTAPIVARVDAQSVLPPRYLKRAVATLQRTGAVNVGGIQRPVGDDGLQRVIAVGMCSPFGAGPARFRRDGYEGPTDTVYLGVFRRDALVAVGGFDETLDRNQDYELNLRLREAGGEVWLDPALVVTYRPRATFSQLASQYFQYGAWKRHVLRRNPRSLKPRQTVAPLLVVGLIVSAVDLLRGRARGWLLPAAYAGSALLVARDNRPELPRKTDRYLLMAVFATMHVAWGAGFLFGRLRRGAPSVGLVTETPAGAR